MQRVKRTPFGSALMRVCRVVALMGLVCGSLLVFPGWLPAMIAVWCVWYTISAFRGGAAWLPLFGCALVILAKSPAWLPWLIVFTVYAGALGAIQLLWVSGKRDLPPSWRIRFTLPTWLGLIGIWSVMSWQWHTATQVSQPPAWSPDRPVVCLGDSLSSATSRTGGYPEELSEMLSVEVVNLARPGITTEEALCDLDKLKSLNPQLVVVELGGHDYLRGYSRAETKKKLEQICDTVEQLNGQVFLVEVPRGFIRDPYSGLERELAWERDLHLISDSMIRGLVLWSSYSPPGMWVGEPYLSDDGLHPNENGERYMAEQVRRAVHAVYGDAALVQ